MGVEHSRLGSIGQEWIQVFRKQTVTYLYTNPQIIWRARKHPIVSFVIAYARLRGDEKILEAGCGGGLYGLALATFGCECTELDCSQEMLDNVEAAKTAYEGHIGPLEVVARRGDLTDLSALRERFDVVFNEGVIEHWVDQNERRKILAEMVRATRPGGAVVVCIPNNSHPIYPWWYFLQRMFRSSWLIFRPGGELEEAIINAGEIERELIDVGLENVMSDGFGVTRTICYYPRWPFLRAIAKLLERTLPAFPMKVRRKWGVYLLAGGTKPHSGPDGRY